MPALALQRGRPEDNKEKTMAPVDSAASPERELRPERAGADSGRASARHLALAEVTKRLCGTATLEAALDVLASVVVPSLADWSFAVHKGVDGGPTVVAFAHRDHSKRQLLRQLFRPQPARQLGAPDLRIAEPTLSEDIQPGALETLRFAWPAGTVGDVEQVSALRALGLRSLLQVPILGREGVEAVVGLTSADDPHGFDRDDVLFARTLADFAAIALQQGRRLGEALQAVRVRDDFLGLAAHKLRTPLTPLLLHVQLLGQALDRGSLADDVAHRSVGACQTQVRRLSDLINELADVARSLTSGLDLHLEELDLRDLVGRLVATMRDDFRRAGCDLTIRGDAKLRGHWDRARLELVVMHLLSNAITYGAGKPVEVTLGTEGERAVVSVRDHGVGMAADAQARIFDRFEHAVHVESGHGGGLGLGLYLCVQILRAHRGSLRIESEPGQGACFVVELPLAHPSKKAADAGGPVEPPAASDPLHSPADFPATHARGP